MCSPGRTCALDDCDKVYNVNKFMIWTRCRDWDNGMAKDFLRGIRWYGYRHVTGSYHLHRYSSIEEIREAIESDFVGELFGPYKDCDRIEAHEQMRLEITASVARTRLLKKSQLQKLKEDQWEESRWTK